MYKLSTSVSMSNTMVIAPIIRDLLSALKSDEHLTARSLSEQDSRVDDVGSLTGLRTLFGASNETVTNTKHEN